MNFLSSKEIAEKWGISQRRVICLAQEGRIADARILGKTWMIPENAEKPPDGRVKKTKAEHQENNRFRYPLFEHLDISSFHPPLSREELQIKQTAEAFHACRFEEANQLLGCLPEMAQEKSIRIIALYSGCMVDIFLCQTERFFDRYSKLRAELQGDFPHKVELQEYLYQLEAMLGSADYYDSTFTVRTDYSYHPSFLPRLATLAAIPLSYATTNLTLAEIRAHEVNCVYLEQTNAYVDLQSMHIYLGSAYAFLGMREDTTRHFIKALALAEQYELYYIPAEQYYYLRKMFHAALEEFPSKFKRRLLQVSDDMHSRYLRFTNEISLNPACKQLLQKDYILIYYAAKGYTNREVARLLHLSEGTVGKRYGEIYSTLGVTGKAELIELYQSSVGKLRLQENP